MVPLLKYTSKLQKSEYLISLLWKKKVFEHVQIQHPVKKLQIQFSRIFVVIIINALT